MSFRNFSWTNSVSSNNLKDTYDWVVGVSEWELHMIGRHKGPDINAALDRTKKSRFDLILIAARRARQIQDYDAELAQKENQLRNTSVLAIHQARAKVSAGGKEIKIESELRELKNNPIQIYVDNSDHDKPAVVALREIEAGHIDKEQLDKQENIDAINRKRDALKESDKYQIEEDEFAMLMNSLNDDEDFNMDDDDDDDF